MNVENPAGVLQAIVVAKTREGYIDIRSAAYLRSTQILLRGYVPIYRASEKLRAALLALI